MKRILIADDEPHVLRVLTLTLERQGYAVETVANGAAALERLHAGTPPDALVTDISMPLMTGRELCRRIAAEFPGRSFPILVMTGMTEHDERSWVNGQPRLRVVEKPVSPRALVAILADALAEAAGDAHG